MNKNLKMCIEVSTTPLKMLNESKTADSSNKYIFSGVFTACSVPGHVVINRNNRSYPEIEVCKHLTYLRESIKNQGCLLGELDHPEGRFDIQLKEASHKITDLWYDQSTHCVMGKLELLDTPNGKIAKELVEANYPLFVSSRAAGDVDEKTHEVSIAQIFTYDIVCTPGFEEARLDRVNESVLSDVTKNFLNESASIKKGKKTMNEKLGVTTKNVEVYEINEEVDINEKVSNMIKKPIDLKDLCTPLLEEDETFELPTAETDPKAEAENKEDKEDKKEVKKDESPEKKEKIDADKDDLHEDEDKKEKKRSAILSIKGEDEDGDAISADIENTEDSEKEENREKILDIQAEEETESDDEEIESNDEEESEEKDDASEDDVQECTLKKDKLAAETEKEIAELDAVLDSVIKTESIKESIVRRYPFAISLSDKNFAKFAALRPNQKKKCADFILEHEIFNVKAINELWSTPLKEEKRVQQNWLKLASQSDIDLYVKAPIEVQDAIEESAKYVILETQEDVDEFWRKTGLRQAEARRRMNEEFVSYYKNNMQANQEEVNQNPLGYNMDFIRMTEDWFNNN